MVYFFSRVISGIMCLFRKTLDLLPLKWMECVANDIFFCTAVEVSSPAEVFSIVCQASFYAMLHPLASVANAANGILESILTMGSKSLFIHIISSFPPPCQAILRRQSIFDGLHKYWHLILCNMTKHPSGVQQRCVIPENTIPSTPHPTGIPHTPPPEMPITPHTSPVNHIHTSHRVNRHTLHAIPHSYTQHPYLSCHPSRAMLSRHTAPADTPATYIQFPNHIA